MGYLYPHHTSRINGKIINVIQLAISDPNLHYADIMWVILHEVQMKLSLALAVEVTML